jgi:UDP-3-O-[3-hydroxymyristoyl] glucosamine N-acyltransferase
VHLRCRRVTLEEGVWIGPGVTLINGIVVGKNGRVNIGSVATRDVPENCAVTGNFALEHEKFLRNLKYLNSGEMFHSKE